MNRCEENPAVPCAMTGACAVLSGLSDLTIIIHGSSGCYYYPKSLLKTPLYSTFLMESEIILGTVDRLREVVAKLERSGKTVAVINTCIPALTGEDLSAAFESTNVIFVDSPGYKGTVETGVKTAYDALNIPLSPEKPGVNIEGILALDRYSRGNLHEAERLLSLMHIPYSLKLSADSYSHLKTGGSPYSISVNPSWNAGIGTNLGSFLFPSLTKTIDRLEQTFPDGQFDMVREELKKADDMIFYYADKYLRKYAPPAIAVISQKSYCTFAEKMFTRYFGSDIVASFPREEISDERIIADKLMETEPELLLGSSFEDALLSRKNHAFVGITQPDKTRITMSAEPITGIEGGIFFMETCLNTLLNAKKKEMRK